MIENHETWKNRDEVFAKLCEDVKIYCNTNKESWSALTSKKIYDEGRKTVIIDIDFKGIETFYMCQFFNNIYDTTIIFYDRYAKNDWNDYLINTRHVVWNGEEKKDKHRIVIELTNYEAKAYKGLVMFNSMIDINVTLYI